MILGGQKKVPLSPFWAVIVPSKNQTREAAFVPACGYWDVDVHCHSCFSWRQCRPTPHIFEWSFKGSQKDFPKLKLWTGCPPRWGMFLVRTACGAETAWSEKTGRTQRRQSPCMCHEWKQMLKWPGLASEHVIFFGWLSPRHPHWALPRFRKARLPQQQQIAGSPSSHMMPCALWL